MNLKGILIGPEDFESLVAFHPRLFGEPGLDRHVLGPGRQLRGLVQEPEGKILSVVQPPPA